MLRKFDITNKEVEKQCLDEVIALVSDFEDTNIGIIAAQELIDTVKQKIGPEIYNQAIKDIQKILGDKFDDIHAELSALEQ